MLLARWRREHKDDTGYTKEVEPESASDRLMRIVFFGTPEFAVAALRALLRERFTVAGVVTQPDKPQGRSRSTLVPPPVKTAALEARPPGAPAGPARRAICFSPASGGWRPISASWSPTATSSGREVLDAPARGMINVHASLLPRFRGAAPIQHAILAGDRETGISIMRMEEGLDSGPVLHRLATPIGDGETAGSLTPKLAELGASALVEALSLLSAGSIMPQPQDAAPSDLCAEDLAGRRRASTGAGSRPCSSARSGPSIRCRAPGRRSMGRR